MKITRFFLCMFASTFLVAQPDNLILNHQFSSPSGGTQKFQENVPRQNEFWFYETITAGGSGGVYNPGTAEYTDEANYGMVGFAAKARLVQELSGTQLNFGNTYNIEVQVGWRNNNSVFGGYLIAIRTGTLSLPLTPTNGIPEQGAFKLVQVTFTPDPQNAQHVAMVNSGENIELILESSGSNGQANFDNVSFTVDPSSPPVTFCPSVPDHINTDITLSVPSQYASIDEALECLDFKRIGSTGSVTIQVADGTYAVPETIKFAHPDGLRISILGNLTTPENVVLQCTQGGFRIEPQNILGMLDGFTLAGTGGARGIDVRNASLNLGSAMVIDNFSRGIFGLQPGHITSNGLTITNCNVGIQVAQFVRAYFYNLTIQGSQNQALVANLNSMVDLRSATLDSGRFGILAFSKSYVSISDTVIQNFTDTAIRPMMDSFIQLISAIFLNNGSDFDILANQQTADGSYIEL